jgi:hypothetical protein
MGAVARTRRNTTIALGSVIAVLGLVMIVATIARGGGPIALGVLVGTCFTVYGAGRVYLATASRPDDRA